MTNMNRGIMQQVTDENFCLKKEDTKLREEIVRLGKKHYSMLKLLKELQQKQTPNKENE